MRIVIVKPSGTVQKNGVSRDDLDLSSCGLPSNLWALQWNEQGDNTGHLEYVGADVQNETITELPSWVNPCLAVWQAELDREAAEIAAEIAAQESNP
jgi:hypothetical protein